MIRTTSVFTRNIVAYNAGKKYIVNQGGTSSSKTWSVLQLLYLIAVYSKKSLTISVISETLPHLKRGAMADWETILKDAGAYSEKMHNKTDHTYTIGRCKVEFFSAENSGKVTGPRRDILYINECNNVPYSVFEQADIRTRGAVFLDFNPTNEFWVHERVLTLPEQDVEFIKSTYLDNDELSPEIIRKIESRRDIDPRWWKVYGEGELGSLDGLVFPSITLIDQLAPSDRVRFGMDFGFTNDPTTLMEVRIVGDELQQHEHLYRTAMTTGEIIRELKAILPYHHKVIADSSDPRTIEEIRRAGINIYPAVKGPDSINLGLDLMRQYRQSVTKSSVNAIKERRNYSWQVDRATGKAMNRPIDGWDHTIDPVRYALTDLITRQPVRAVRANF